MDMILIANYMSLNFGFRMDIPHERVMMITISFLFWSLMFVFGATIDRDFDDE